MEQPTRVVKQAKPAAESSLMDDLLNMDLTTTTQTSQATPSDDPFASDLMGMMDVIDTMGSSQQPAPSSPVSKPQRKAPPPPSSSPPMRASPSPPSSSPPKRPFPSPPSSPPPQAPSSPSSRPPITPSSKPALPTSTCFVIDDVRIEPSLSTEEIKLNSQETDDEFDAVADDISIGDFDMTIMNTNKASDNHDVRLSSILRPSFVENARKDMLT